jgi:hypothetical protein
MQAYVEEGSLSQAKKGRKTALGIVKRKSWVGRGEKRKVSSIRCNRRRSSSTALGSRHPLGVKKGYHYNFPLHMLLAGQFDHQMNKGMSIDLPSKVATRPVSKPAAHLDVLDFVEPLPFLFFLAGSIQLPLAPGKDNVSEATEILRWIPPTLEDAR